MFFLSKFGSVMVRRAVRKGGFLIILLLLAFSACSGMPVKKNIYYSEDELLMVESSAESIGLGFGYDSRSDLNYFFFKQPIDESILKSPVEFQQMPSTEGQEQTDGLSGSKDVKGVNKDNTVKESTENDISVMAGAFAEAMNKYDDRTVFYLYLKVYSIYEATEYMTGWYQRHEKWRLYNQARLDYLPAARWYMKYLDAYCQSGRPGIYSELLPQKADVKRDAILEFQKRMTITDDYM